MSLLVTFNYKKFFITFRENFYKSKMFRLLGMK